MDFDFSDEQTMLADSAARYVREHCDLASRRHAAKSEPGFSRSHWHHFAEQGWLALTLPPAVGGLGLGPIELAVLMEALGHGLVCEPLVDSTILCGSLLASASAPDDTLLSRLARGEAIAALAHMERGARSEYDTPVATQAQPDGQGWTLNGSKHLVFHSNAATHLIVSARLPGEVGYSLFAAARDAAGIECDSYALIDGTRAADLRFNGVRVAAAGQLHGAIEAAAALEQALDSAILALSAQALGSMEAVLALTANHLTTREQYGQPLARFQALKHRMADMLVETEQARSMVYRALSIMTHEGDPDRRRRAISGAKALVAQAGLFVAGHAIQLHGGIGVTEEYAVGHHYKALRVYDKRFGDRDFHLQRCARPASENQLRENYEN